MNERARKLEKLKNAVIVVLFLTTVLLLNLTWRSEGTGRFRLSSVLDFISPDVWVPDASEFVAADYTVCGFGDATFSRETDRAASDLAAILQTLRTESSNASFLVNEVTVQQYREMITGFRSLKVELSCPVPFGEFCERNQINRSSVFDQVWIDGRLVVDNGTTVKKNPRNDNSIALMKGLHSVRVVFLSNIIGGWYSSRGRGEITYRKYSDEEFHTFRENRLFCE